MFMKQSWKRTGTTTLFSHPRLTVVEDDVTLPDGHQTKYLRFEGLESYDYVTIIATDDGKMAFLKEYAYPADAWLWQLPDGTFDEGETALQAGIRELQEEAGLVAEDITEIGAYLGHYRRSVRKAHVMHAPRVTQGVKAQGDIEEQGTELHWIPIEEVRSMIRDGRIIQHNTLSALAMYFVISEVKSPTQQ